MSYSITFDVGTTMACLTIPWLGDGLFLLLWGWHLRRRAFTRLPRPPRPSDQLWWGRLGKWGALSPAGAGWEVLQAFTRSFDLLLSSFLLGLGLVMLLLLFGAGILALAAGTLVSLTALTSGQLSGVIPYLSLLIGGGVGLADGFWQLRNSSARRVTYGDLQPRRLADYRSGAFRWLMLALLALVIVETSVLGPHIGPVVPIRLGHWRFLPLPTSFWILGILPATMFLLLVGGEVLMAYIVRLPRLLVTSDPQTAQRADNFLRALSIGLVQATLLISLGYLGENQDGMLDAGLWQQHFWQMGGPQPYLPLAEVVSLLAWVSISLGFVLPVCAGRIGGRLGGWPWQKMRVT
ncbi:MAG TPA: hypothetical protein VH599_10105 [Ktedonobacterales bacterium]|jgi:hypothetical protein